MARGRRPRGRRSAHRGTRSIPKNRSERCRSRRGRPRHAFGREGCRIVKKRKKKKKKRRKEEEEGEVRRRERAGSRGSTNGGPMIRPNGHTDPRLHPDVARHATQGGSALSTSSPPPNNNGPEIAVVGSELVAAASAPAQASIQFRGPWLHPAGTAACPPQSQKPAAESGTWEVQGRSAEANRMPERGSQPLTERQARQTGPAEGRRNGKRSMILLTPFVAFAERIIV